MNLQNNTIFRFDMFVLSICYVLLLFFVLSPAYETNDVPTVIRHANDGFIVTVSHHFLSYAIYFLNKGMQSNLWYGILTYIFTAICITINLSIFKYYLNKNVDFIIFLIVYFVYVSYFVLFIQYTNISIFSGVSSVLAFAHLYYNNNLTFLKSTVLGMLFSASALFRVRGLEAVITIIFPLLLIITSSDVIDVWKNKITRRALLVKWSFLLILLIPSLLVYSYDFIYKGYLSPPQYRQWYEFDKLRSDIHDTPTARLNVDNQDMYDNTGWSPDDYENLRYWFFIDENIYNIKSLSKYHAVAKRPDYRAPIASIVDVFKEYHQFMILFAALLLMNARQGKKSFILSSTILIYALVVAALLHAYIRFPLRLGYPMFFSFSLILFYLHFWLKADNAENKNHR